MASNPDPAWRTGIVAIRPWAAPLSQHGLPKVVAVTRVGSAAAEVARTTGGRSSRAGGEQGQARARLQTAEVAGEDGECGRCLRVRQREERIRVPDSAKTIGIRCAARPHRGGEELAPVLLEYGHRNQQGAQGAVRARLSHRGLHQDGWGVDALLAQSGDARRIDSDDSQGTWLVGDTPPLGAGSARRGPPAVERSGSGRRTARVEGPRQAQWPGGPSPGTAVPARPGDQTATTVGVRGRAGTLPFLG